MAQFVVDSYPCPEAFSPGSPVFFPSQKLTFPNSNSTRMEDDVTSSLNIVICLFLLQKVFASL